MKLTQLNADFKLIQYSAVKHNENIDVPPINEQKHTHAHTHTSTVDTIAGTKKPIQNTACPFFW